MDGHFRTGSNPSKAVNDITCFRAFKIRINHKQSQYRISGERKQNRGLVLIKLNY